MLLNKKSGFTVIEVLIFITVLIILFLVGAPKFSSYKYLVLDTVAKRLVTDLEYARSISMSQPLDGSNVVKMGYISLATNSYDINLSGGIFNIFSGYPDRVPDPINPARPLSVTFSIGDYKDITLKASSFGGTGNQTQLLYFNSKGQPCNSDGTLKVVNGELSLATRDGLQTKTIEVEPDTGRVYIK